MANCRCGKPVTPTPCPKCGCFLYTRGRRRVVVVPQATGPDVQAAK